jgi:hypothetical protein
MNYKATFNSTKQNYLHNIAHADSVTECNEQDRASFFSSRAKNMKTPRRPAAIPKPHVTHVDLYVVALVGARELAEKANSEEIALLLNKMESEAWVVVGVEDGCIMFAKGPKLAVVWETLSVAKLFPMLEENNYVYLKKKETPVAQNQQASPVAQNQQASPVAQNLESQVSANKKGDGAGEGGPPKPLATKKKFVLVNELLLLVIRHAPYLGSFSLSYAYTHTVFGSIFVIIFILIFRLVFVLTLFFARIRIHFHFHIQTRFCAHIIFCLYPNSFSFSYSYPYSDPITSKEAVSRKSTRTRKRKMTPTRTPTRSTRRATPWPP